MFKTKSYSENYKQHTVSKFCKAKKIVNRRKKCWMNLFTKYSQPILNKTEINIKTMTEEDNTNVLKLDKESKTKCAPQKRENFLSHLKYLISHSLKPKSPDWFDLSDEIESENDMNIRFENAKNKTDSEFQKYNNSKRILWSISSSGTFAIDLESNKAIDIKKLLKDTCENSIKLSEDNNSAVKNTEQQPFKQLVFRTQEFDCDSDSDFNSE